MRNVWWFVAISGSQCFTIGTWIIISGPPLETSRVYGGIARRNAMDTIGDTSLVPPCATVLPRITQRSIFIRAGSPWNDLADPYSMVCDWRVLRPRPIPHYLRKLSCSLPFVFYNFPFIFFITIGLVL